MQGTLTRQRTMKYDCFGAHGDGEPSLSSKAVNQILLQQIARNCSLYEQKYLTSKEN